MLTVSDTRGLAEDRSGDRLVERLAASGVDSITALGSTGSYAYLTATERALVARLAVEHAGKTPAMSAWECPVTPPRPPA